MAKHPTGEGSVPPRYRWRSWPIVLAVLGGLALTFGAFDYVRKADAEQLQGEFDRVTANLEMDAMQRFESHLDVLLSMRDYFDADGVVSRAEFGIFARQQIMRHPGIHALEWVPRVTAAERGAFEAMARREGLAGFQLTEVNAAKQLRTAGSRPVYFPVFYVEPVAGNERALGFAPSPHPREAAIAEAIATGGPAATGRFNTVQNHSSGYGVAIFVPVFTGAIPATPAARETGVRGLVEGILLPDDILAASIAEARKSGIAVTLMDQSAPAAERSLLRHEPPGTGASSLQSQAPFELAGRKWVLSFALVDPAALGSQSSLAWLVLLIGLTATALLGGYLFVVLNQRARVEAMVVERTRALEQEQALARTYMEEAAVRQAELKQAQEIDRLKSNFVSAVSHDLRTPLTSIMGYAEFLEDHIGGELSDAQQAFVGQIVRGAKRLEYLVDDLLDFARLDAGTFQLRREPADLGRHIHEVVESLRPQVEEAGLHLVVEPFEGSMEVPMDTLRVERVLVNLLHNAIKFTPKGGTITVRARRQGDGLRCEVSDTGIGIPADQISRLFQRFSQLTGGTEKGGTGLGLSICKAIVDAHGGDIGVESEAQRGSTFWFTIPTV